MKNTRLAEYICPYDLWNGKVKKGDIFTEFLKTDGSKSLTVTTRDSFSNYHFLPIEIVQSWEKVVKIERWSFIRFLKDTDGCSANTVGLITNTHLYSENKSILVYYFSLQRNGTANSIITVGEKGLTEGIDFEILYEYPEFFSSNLYEYKVVIKSEDYAFVGCRTFTKSEIETFSLLVSGHGNVTISIENMRVPNKYIQYISICLQYFTEKKKRKNE